MIKQGKSNTVLMELVVVILFFALSAGVTLRLFALAHNQSLAGERNTHAALLAQDWAERLRMTEDPAALLETAGFAWEGMEYALYLDEARGPALPQEAVYVVRVGLEVQEMARGRLNQAEVSVFCLSPLEERMALSIPSVGYWPAGPVEPEGSV